MDRTDFNAFIGADPGGDLGDMYKTANLGLYSLLNRKHYYDTYTGEPSIIIGYNEMLFNIAEGIARGWAAGDAEANYRAGIKTSMSFYSIPEDGSMQVFFLKSGASLGNYVIDTVDVDFNTYYAQTLVKYSADQATAINQILTQSISLCSVRQVSSRTTTIAAPACPAFTTGPGTGNSGRIALRFKYPTVESSANSAHYTDALNRQYSGNDRY